MRIEILNASGAGRGHRSPSRVLAVTCGIMWTGCAGNIIIVATPDRVASRCAPFRLGARSFAAVWGLGCPASPPGAAGRVKYTRRGAGHRVPADVARRGVVGGYECVDGRGGGRGGLDAGAGSSGFVCPGVGGMTQSARIGTCPRRQVPRFVQVRSEEEADLPYPDRLLLGS